MRATSISVAGPPAVSATSFTRQTSFSKARLHVKRRSLTAKNLQTPTTLHGLDENILNSTRSTDFITPKSEVSRTFRNAALLLARDCGFARALVNSGRLSKPSILTASPLNTPDEDRFGSAMAPGAPIADAPLLRDGKPTWLLDQTGNEFTLLRFSDDVGKIGGEGDDGLRRLATGDILIKTVVVTPKGSGPRFGQGLAAVEDAEGLAAERFDAAQGATYLIRPDQHVCARWRTFDPAKIERALDRATARA